MVYCRELKGTLTIMLYSFQSQVANHMKDYEDFFGILSKAARMSPMGSSSRNAGDRLDRLKLTYNRTCQALIITELIEIISGASLLTG
ncbi:hypothetical protein FRX31_021860 [Thalictrum thalictroides]|uniref:Uncharacterized protein n=1 Tax=Thalictrum thalictroides TaxID=46969 RepID=A0A7J6VTZ3_THATH|nr:hypothetical protein FRX31_021860 [Thalictrum thalictroides]